MRTLGWVVTILVAAVLALFAISNQETVELGLWPVPDTLSLEEWIPVYAAALLGLIVGRVSLWPRHLRLKSDFRRQAKQLAAAQKSLDQGAIQAPSKSLTTPRAAA